MSDSINRRNFIRSSAAVGAGLAVSPGLFADTAKRKGKDQINVGIIGCGSQGQILVESCLAIGADSGIRFKAVCDIWDKIKFAVLVALVVLLCCGELSLASVEIPAGDSKQSQTFNLCRVIDSEDLPGAPGFADPYVFREGGKWFITSTYTARRLMYMASTTDFKTIDGHKLSLDLNQGYLRKHFKSSWLVARDVWGFVPYKHDDGSWHGYASIHIGRYKTFVCHFSPVSDKPWPITDWRLDKVMVGDKSKTPYESKVYSDKTGTYLIYVDRLSDGNNHIMAQKLIDPENVDTSFKARAILSPEGLRSEDRNEPGSMQIVEGPNISRVVTEDGSKYVMFYAVGDFALKNYKLGVAYSDVLIPSDGKQYQKPKAKDKSNLFSNDSSADEVVYTLQTQMPGWFNYAGTLLKGPGLGNLVEYQGDYYMIFHAHDAGKSRGRWVWRCPVTIDFTKKMELWVVPNLPIKDD